MNNNKTNTLVKTSTQVDVHLAAISQEVNNLLLSYENKIRILESNFLKYDTLSSKGRRRYRRIYSYQNSTTGVLTMNNIALQKRLVISKPTHRTIAGNIPRLVNEIIEPPKSNISSRLNLDLYRPNLTVNTTSNFGLNSLDYSNGFIDMRYKPHYNFTPLQEWISIKSKIASPIPMDIQDEAHTNYYQQGDIPPVDDNKLNIVNIDYCDEVKSPLDNQEGLSLTYKSDYHSSQSETKVQIPELNNAFLSLRWAQENSGKPFDKWTKHPPFIPPKVEEIKPPKEFETLFKQKDFEDPKIFNYAGYTASYGDPDYEAEYFRYGNYKNYWKIPVFMTGYDYNFLPRTLHFVVKGILHVYEEQPNKLISLKSLIDFKDIERFQGINPNPFVEYFNEKIRNLSIVVLRYTQNLAAYELYHKQQEFSNNSVTPYLLAVWKVFVEIILDKNFYTISATDL